MRLEYSDNISELASAVKGMLSPKDYILLQLFNAFKTICFQVLSDQYIFLKSISTVSFVSYFAC